MGPYPARGFTRPSGKVALEDGPADLVAGQTLTRKLRIIHAIEPLELGGSTRTCADRERELVQTVGQIRKERASVSALAHDLCGHNLSPVSGHATLALASGHTWYTRCQ